MAESDAEFIAALVSIYGNDADLTIRRAIIGGFKDFAERNRDVAEDSLRSIEPDRNLRKTTNQEIYAWWLVKVADDVPSNLKFIKHGEMDAALVFFDTRNPAYKNRPIYVYPILYWLYVYCENDRYAKSIEKKIFPKGTFEAQFGAPVPTTELEAEALHQALEDEKQRQVEAKALGQKNHKQDEPSLLKFTFRWLAPKFLRWAAIAVFALFFAGATLLAVGWPRQATNTILYEIATSILPVRGTTGEFVSGFDYEIEPDGEIENLRSQIGIALLDELYNRGSSLAAGILGSRYRHGYFVKKDIDKALEYLRFAEQENDPRALGVFAVMLSQGDKIDSVKRSEREAQNYSNELFRRAIEVDVNPQNRLAIAGAYLSLGKNHSLGLGVTQDFNKTVELYDLAIENGSALAINNLGVNYAKGLGVPKNVSRAAELYREAYELGNEVALINLADLLENAADSEKGYRDAAKLFAEGNSEGNTWATTRLAHLIETGKLPAESGGFQPADPAKAEELYLKSASKGDPASMWHLGQLYEGGQLGKVDLDGAKHWYAKLEQTDQPYYLAKLGGHYLQVGFIPMRVDRAIEVLEKAERLGSAWASFELGELFLSSSTIGYSGEDAAEKFRNGMTSGGVEAQYLYGELLLDTDTLPTDEKYGRELILAAAAQKVPWIMYRTAKLLLKSGDKKDFEIALHLHQEAAELGHGWSRGELNRIYASDEFGDKGIKSAVEQLELLIDAQDVDVLQTMVGFDPWWDEIIWPKQSETGCALAYSSYCLGTNKDEWIHTIREIAELGIPDARAILALYFAENGRCEDAEREINLLKIDAKKEIPEVQYILSSLPYDYQWGDKSSECGSPLDEDQAKSYLLAAGAGGNFRAVSVIHQLSLWPDGANSQPDWLAQLEKNASQSGDARLWGLLGNIYQDEQEQPWKAEFWYRKATEGSQLHTAQDLANLYLSDFPSRRIGDAIAVVRKYMEPDDAIEFLDGIKTHSTLYSLNNTDQELLEAAIKDLKAVVD